MAKDNRGRLLAKADNYEAPESWRTSVYGRK